MKRPIKLLSATLSLLLLFSAAFRLPALAEVSGTFSDVPINADYAEAVEELTGLGVLSGYEDGTFKPDATMTRAEFTSLVCNLLGVGDEARTLTKCGFSDVPNGHWATGYIAKAYDLGIIDGYGNGIFKPTGTITYAQAVKMLVCAWDYGDMAEEAGGWPDGYISVADDMGITEGLSVSIDTPALRSTVAVLAYNTLMCN